MNKRTIAKFWRSYKDKGIKSIVLALLLWIASSVGIFFILRSYVPSDFEVYFDDNVLAVTLILSGVTLVLTIVPMIEYLFIFHRRAGMHDPYRWFIFPIVFGIIALITICVLNNILIYLGWIAVIQIADIALVVLLPRLLWAP